MKKASILLFVLSLFLFACKTEPTEKAETPSPQNSKSATAPPPTAPVNLDKESDQLLFLSRLYLKYNSSGKVHTDKIRTELTRVKNKDMDFVKSFVFSSTQQSETLLSNQFLKKPAQVDLQRIFQLRRINTNSMSKNGVTTAVIDTFDINSVSNEELVSTYYRLVANGLQLSRNPKASFHTVNIDLNNLELADNKEKGILFYIVADIFSRRYNRANRNNLNCADAKKLVQTFPTVNGQVLFKAAPPTFEDFTVNIGNWAPNKSFKGYFTNEYVKTVAHFGECK